MNHLEKSENSHSSLPAGLKAPAGSFYLKRRPLPLRGEWTLVKTIKIFLALDLLPLLTQNKPIFSEGNRFYDSIGQSSKDLYTANAHVCF